MLKWTPIPLVRITAIFCAGILLGIYQFRLISFELALYGGATAFIFYTCTYFLIKKYRNLKYVAGIFSFMVLFFGGFLLVQVRTESSRPLNILNFTEPIQSYEAVVEGHLEEKKSSLKTTVVVKRVKTKAGWSTASGKVNLYISKKTYHYNLQWGDRIVIRGMPGEVQPPGNPHEFDFKRFLSFRNIYHQQFIQGDDFTHTGITEYGFLHYSSKARAYFSSIIKKYVHGDDEQAISLALVIGVTDGIDNELVNAYSASGAMHVLAVSGLHVGIIYWMILLLLKPLQKTTRGQWMVALLSLAILWGYSFITGLSPSVLRAVTMFSFMAVAKPLNIRSNIFNTLAGSAFILLLYDPYLIMSVGFQLSYLAVFGIIWIQRPLYQLYEARSWLMDQVWKITCVSIAAQATTFSLGLLYFHQFPTYFLFSNLFVIPISFVVLVAGIALIVVSALEPIAEVVGWILQGSSKILNEGVFIVEDLPFSIINNIYIDVFQSWLIMAILVSLIFVFQYKKIQWLYVSLTFAIVFSVARWIHYSERTNEVKIFVYNVSGQSAFEIKEGDQSIFIADSMLLLDEERIRFHIKPNRLFNMVSEVKTISYQTLDGYSTMEYHGKSMLVISKSINNFSSKINPNFVILGKGAAWKTPEIVFLFPKAKIILDSSWGAGQLKWLRSQPSIIGKKIYSVSENGAFVASL